MPEWAKCKTLDDFLVDILFRRRNYAGKQVLWDIRLLTPIFCQSKSVMNNIPYPCENFVSKDFICALIWLESG